MDISRAMGLARGTVRKFAHAQSYPERAGRAPGPSLLARFVPHLEARLAAGCENGTGLWRERRALGYPGTAKQVHRWLQDRRTAPAKTTAPRWRKDAPVQSSGTLPLLAPRRLAWALVRPLKALNDEEAAAVAQIEKDPEAARVAGLARRFTAMVRAASKADARGGAIAELDAWLADARSCGVAAVETFATGLEQDRAAVRAALTTPWSSGQAEGQINRLKLLKRHVWTPPALQEKSG